MLQLFALALWVIPSIYVVSPIGNMGYPAALVGLFVLLVWFAYSLLGYHDPRRHANPIQAAFAGIWLVSLVSYMLIDRSDMGPHELLGADRWLLQLAMLTGVAFAAAEGLRSLKDIRRVLRAMVWGAAFSGVVGAIQFWASVDLTTYAKYLPGFTLNANDPEIVLRGSLNRVVGTAIDPIELGVAAGMMLPLAVYLAIYDTGRSQLRRWLPVVLIGVAVMVSVSRSAVIAVIVTIGLLVVLMPIRQRLWALAILPVGILGAFMTAHGLLGTLVKFFGYGNSDSSISHRTGNYPYVWSLFKHTPWLGEGGGTFIPTPLHILDNQYLMAAVDLGALGVIAFIVLFLVPLVAALRARLWTSSEELRLLLAALAGGCAVALLCSATFDSFSFPVFYCSFALVAGIVGAAWRLARSEAAESARNPYPIPTAKRLYDNGA
jgi:O-antigen ligase